MIPNSKIRTTSGLFLMELIWAILIFAIAGSACISVFISSHSLSQTAHELSAASHLVRNEAEEIRGNDTATSSTRRFLDQNFAECDEAQAVYSFFTDVSQDGTLEQVQLVVDHLPKGGQPSEEIYTLTVIHHVKEADT